ncbi:phage tail protein, partial [Enterococcus faecium]|nr:phage tail protein [Enterococcus faecium]
KDGQTFKIYSGTGTSDALVLKNGENILYVTGTGTLTIDFRKEII